LVGRLSQGGVYSGFDQRLTGIGWSKLYMLIQEGHIEVVEVGSVTLIPMQSLE
jgi:hypothetical protein